MIKRLFLCTAALLSCGVLFAGELQSDAFTFTGTVPVPYEVIPQGGYEESAATPIYYNTGWANGTPESIVISYADQSDSGIAGTVFQNSSSSSGWGFTNWDYLGVDPADLPRGDTYTLKQTVTSELETTDIETSVTLVPEPAAVLALVLLGAFLMRKRAGKLLAAFLALGTIGAFSSEVTSVSCFQNIPFNNQVVINFTLTKTTSKTSPVFEVSFSGVLTQGGESFDLASHGTITGAGHTGVVLGEGTFQAVWTPDSTLASAASEDMRITVSATDVTDNADYLKLDLTSHQMTFSASGPVVSEGAACKKTELWLRRIEPGTFVMGSATNEVGRASNWTEDEHSVTITKAFYIAVFETTQAQYTAIFGSNPSDSKTIGDCNPVNYVSYNDVRGADLGSAWPDPADYRVDPTSFFGVMRETFGKNLKFDLPTDWQWEMACRDKGDGTYLGSSCWNDGSPFTMTSSSATSDSNLDKLAWYSNTKPTSTSYVLEVGTKNPSLIGLYDMHGNVTELTINYYRPDNKSYTLDPAGPSYSTAYKNRAVRNGNTASNPSDLRIARRPGANSVTSKGRTRGFRMVLVP